MAAIADAESFTTDLSVEEVTERFRAFHSSKGGAVTTASDGALEGTTGSQVKVRLLGAFFVSRSQWPLKTRLRLEPTPDGTDVEMTVADDFGIGIRTGIKAKYDELIQERSAEVKAALS
jgi:hypothetical protein